MLRWSFVLLAACGVAESKVAQLPTKVSVPAPVAAPAAETDAPEVEDEEPGPTGKTGPTGPTGTSSGVTLKPPSGLTRYLTGGADDAVITLGNPALILMGGGTDVDAVFTWAAGTVAQGDVVILRASGADGYNDYLYTDIGGFDSVETLIVDSKALANDAFVEDRIKKAELIFLAGGDQSTYVAAWRGTKLASAVAFAYQRGAIIGGTSAGAMVLSDPIYTGENGSAVSSEVLINPYADEVTLAPAVFPFLQRVLVDTHFTQRDRLGRLVVFLARAYSTPLLGVGIDERTALIVEANGAARVIGSGKVHVVSADQAPETLSDGEPLTYRHLPMQSFSPGATFTLGADALTGEIDCVAGKL